MEVFIKDTGKVKEFIAINPVTKKNHAKQLIQKELGIAEISIISQKEFDSIQARLDGLIQLETDILNLAYEVERRDMLMEKYFKPDEGCKLSEKKCALCGKIGDGEKDMDFIATEENGAKWYCKEDLKKLTITR